MDRALLLCSCMVAVLTLGTPTPLSDYDCNDPQFALSERGVQFCPNFYDLLESALFNGSGYLYQLKTAFFPPNGRPRGTSDVEIYLEVDVNLVGDTACDYDSGDPAFCSQDDWPEHGCSAKNRCISNCEYGRYFSWRTKSTLNEIAFAVLSTTHIYDGIMWIVLSVLAPVELMYLHWKPDDQPGNLFFFLEIDELPCNPDVASTNTVILNLISWLKSYAIAQGRPKAWDEGDRGAVYIDSMETGFAKYYSVQKLMLALFVLTNVSIMLLLTSATPGLYNLLVIKVSRGKRMVKQLYCTIYWSASLVFFFLAMILYLADVFCFALYYECSKLGYPWTHTGTFYACHFLVSVPHNNHLHIIFTVKFVLAILEVISCVVVCIRSRRGIEFPFNCFANIFCCCCFCRRSRNVKFKALQVLALWSIMSFVQRLTVTAIPILCFIILAPGETFSILMLCLSALFCIIMLLSRVLHMYNTSRARNGPQPSRKSSVISFVVQMLLIVSIFTTVIVTIILYLAMLGDGAKFNSFGGFSVSLIPSVALSVFGWFVKKRLLEGSSTTPEVGAHEDLEPASDEDNLVIQN